MINYINSVANKEIELALDIAFKNLDKDTAKAISWCITKTFYKTFQVNLSHCFILLISLYITAQIHSV
jgi:hypothetical protein